MAETLKVELMRADIYMLLVQGSLGIYLATKYLDDLDEEDSKELNTIANRMRDIAHKYIMEKK